MREFLLRLEKSGSGHQVSRDDDIGAYYTVAVPADGELDLSSADVVPLFTVDLPGLRNPAVIYAPGRQAVRKARLKKAAVVAGTAAAGALALVAYKGARAGQREADRLRQLGFGDLVVSGGRRATRSGTMIGGLLGTAIVAATNDQLDRLREEDALELSDREIGKLVKKAEHEGYYSLETGEAVIRGAVRFSDLRPPGSDW
ncbi:hypothetical protein [Lentzea fradiae]|nr:hypothetical protein [Lentzea fradiae]